MMLVIPAIDIMGGKCVRLTRGDFETKKEYSADPVAMAQSFERDGADMLHVVDLDGAKQGMPVNVKSVREIRAAIDIPIEVGGGIRTFEHAVEYFDIGIDRIIVGTKALTDAAFLKSLLNRFGPDRVVVGIDVRDTVIAIEGWKKEISEGVPSVAKRMYEIGVREVIVTDIARDGTLTEPDTSVAQVFKELGFSVVIAGGVSDGTAVKKIAQAGFTGCIIGKAIYEGRISVPDAVRTVVSSPLAKRIIPCMDIKAGRVAKGTNFKHLRDAGDPVELGMLYSDAGADELVYLDVMAATENRGTFLDLVARVAATVNIPFTVGGGMRSISDIRAALNAGADKTGIESAAVTNPDFIRQASEEFGAQCIVVSLAPKRVGDHWELYVRGGREPTGVDAVEFARRMEAMGAGELLVNSLDRDGTKEGYDIPLLKAITDAVRLPVIASSGVGTKEHVLEVFRETSVDAALAASVFHFGEITIPDLKHYLQNNNIHIRP